MILGAQERDSDRSSTSERQPFLPRTHLEVSSRSVHICDHGADVTHDGSEDKDTNQEIHHDKEVLHILLWLWCLSYGGEREGWPVEAVG